MKLIDTTDATIQGGYTRFPISIQDEWRPLQVEISNAATVTVEGRVINGGSWHTVAEYTASSLDKISVFPEMRVVVSGNTGSVVVELAG